MTTAILLTDANCKQCDRAIDVLERVEPDFELEVRVVDVASAEGSALARTIRLVRAPALLLDDDLFSVGRLSVRRLRRELARRAAVLSPPAQPTIAAGADPEVPEGESAPADRGTERQRLRAVRRERRRQAMKQVKGEKNNKKDSKKEKKGKRR